MEHQQILDIINAVSSSNLSSFEYEEGNVHISMSVAASSKAAVQPVEYETAQKTVPEAKPVQAQEGTVVKSPLVGTFYSASSPDAEVFVKVGDKVSKGQTLGIIEAMKLMNEIESEYSGTITQILVENKDVVEYGQPLFIIKED